MATAPIRIVATLSTFTNGARLCRYIPLQGALQGQSRLGFVNKVGKPVKSLPGHVGEVRLVQPKPAKPTKPKAPKAAVVAVEVTAAPPAKPAKPIPAYEVGTTWQSYVAICRTAGFSMKEASAARKAALAAQPKAAKASKASTVKSRKSSSTVMITPWPKGSESPTDCITNKRAARKASEHAATTSLMDKVNGMDAKFDAIMALLNK